MRLKLIIPFLLSAILAGVAIIQINSGNKAGKDENAIVKQIESNLNQQIKSIQDFHKRLLSNDQIKIDRKSIRTWTTCLYKNDSLIQWNDYKLRIPESPYRGPRVELVDHVDNQLLVVQDSIRKNDGLYVLNTFLLLATNAKIENKYIQSVINEEIFPPGIGFKLSQDEGGTAITNGKGQAYFFVDLVNEGNEYKSQSSNQVYLFLLSICFFVYGLLNILFTKKFFSTDVNLAISLGVLLLLRYLMLVLEYPAAYSDSMLFDPTNYAASSFAPTLGDLLLNVITVLTFSFLFFRHYKRSGWLVISLKKSGKLRPLWTILFASLSFMSFLVFLSVLSSLYGHSQLNFDVTHNFQWAPIHLVHLIIFIFLALAYFLFNQVLFRILSRIDSGLNLKNITFYLIGGGFAVPLLSFSEVPSLLLIGHLAFILISVGFNLPGSVQRFQRPAYVYFVLCAFICAFSGSWLLRNSTKERIDLQKNRMAQELLSDYDPLGSYLLHEAGASISKDKFIINLMLNPLTSKDLVVQKIKRVHLPNYFDKYDIKVEVFDALGNSQFSEKEEPGAYASMVKTFRRKEYATNFNDVYFLNDYNTNTLNRFFHFIDLRRKGKVIGFVVLDLELKKIIPHSVYPRLLVDDRFIKNYQENDFQYAIYLNGMLQYSSGYFNYRQTLKDIDGLNSSDVYKEDNLEHHVFYLEDDKSKVAVISSENYDLGNSYSNFSYLFLVLAMTVLLIILIYAFYFRLRRINASFSTKIQIYLNLAYFLPLLIVSITTLSITNQSYNEELMQSFRNKAEGIRNNLADYIEGNQKGYFSDEYLSAAALRIARYSEADINLFDNSGRLVLSSQSIIYESGLLSKYINPVAINTIREGGKKHYVLQESIGKLNYNSLYTPVFSTKTGQQIGIMSLPFFNSAFTTNKKQMGVLGTIMNIFTSFFLIFLIASYAASRNLVIPLRLIAQKLQKTTLSGNNEKIEWKSEDELGLLVHEYNTMIEKLEESREELAKQEKESAWREMAQQVAHEIKNPLTPMKLSLQHLQRKIGDEPEAEGIRKSVNALLVQIETLNDIATSFSAFAKMPVPKNEQFDVKKELEAIVILHNNNENVNVHTEIEDGEYFVNGDRQLMGRIFTNLIINGIQSIDERTEPRITVRLKKKDTNKVTLEFQDNGNGIPEEIQNKVFMPNFSTKDTGSGIGLAVAKRGVTHAGGSIWFETSAKGTTFFIDLPLVK